jgi:adenylate cyclase, class 2
MNIEGSELEVKFYISRRRELEMKLNAIGVVIAPRVLEVNLRFDTPDRALTLAGKVLRLRRDANSRITYKGVGKLEGGANLRQELEFTVSDFDTAKALFEALGYEIYTIYEKYRTTYKVGNVEVVVDELPTGDFLEIEGPDSESIRKASLMLGLNWEAGIMESYTAMFERLKGQLGLSFRDLSFENFKGMEISPEALGVIVADR